MITKLTHEQEAAIPGYINKWVKQASEPTNREEATKAIKELYKRMGEEEPLVIYGQSPNETINLALLTFLLLEGKYSVDDSQLDSHLGSQLNSHLGSQLNSHLYSQLNSQLGSHLHSHLDNQLNSQLDSHLDNQLNSQLRNQLSSQLNNQLSSQLNSHLYSQLYSQLNSQLSSQLNSHLYSQLNSQLSSHLYSQLNSHLYSHLYSQLNSQLSSQLGSQLRSQDNEMVKKILSSLRSTFYEHDWWLVWCGWYDYGQYIGVEFDKDTFDLFMSYNKNVGFIIPYKGIVFVSDRPTAIRWANERLHYDHGKCIEWADGFGYYGLNGVLGFKEEDFNKIVDQTLTLDDLGKIENADQRAIANQWLNPETLIKKEKGEVVSISEKTYNAPQFHGQVLAWFRNKGESIDGEPDLKERHFKEYSQDHKTTLYKLPNYMEQFGEQYVAVFTHPTVPTSRYVKYQDPKSVTDADGFHAWARSTDKITVTKEDWLAMPEA